MRRRWLRGALAVAALLATMGFAACGDDDSGDSSATSAAAPASDTAAAPASDTAAAPASDTAAASGEDVKLTFWFWGDLDAPGANKWLDDAVAAYQTAHPNVTIDVVEQVTETFVETFQAAAAAKSGPDIAAQWATGPVLTQAWAGAITPISDLVPADEVAHWLNTSENTYGDKLWAMPLYLIGVPWVYNKKLMTEAGITEPPATWDEVIAACSALREKDITPFAYGNDYYWTTQLMVQSLDSLQDVVDASTGKASYTDPKFAASGDGWKQMVDAKCFNDDVASIGISQAWDKFAAGEVAMTVGTDGGVRQWAKDLGPENIMVSKWPVFGDGGLKDVYDATQSTSYFVTSWSKHQQEAADFLTFLHSPEQLDAWFAATGVPPADDRFDTTKVTDPLDKQLYEYNTTGPQIWLQNFFPPQIDINGNFPAQDLLLGGQGDGPAAAQIRQRAAEQWRAQQPAELESWSSFTPAG